MRTVRSVALGVLLSCLWVGLVHAADSYDQLFDKGQELIAQGNPAGAIPYFEQATAADPTRIYPLLSIGILQGKLRQYDAAERVLQDAVKRFPDDPMGYYFLAVIKSGQDEVAAMRHYYTEALSRGLNASDDSAGLAGYLAAFKEQALSVTYPSLQGSYTVSVALRGIFVGDKELCRDILAGLEKMEITHGRKQIIETAQVELIRLREQRAISEEWRHITGPQGSHDYLVTSNSNPPPGFPYKVQIRIADYHESPSTLNE